MPLERPRPRRRVVLALLLLRQRQRAVQSIAPWWALPDGWSPMPKRFHRLVLLEQPFVEPVVGVVLEELGAAGAA